MSEFFETVMYFLKNSQRAKIMFGLIHIRENRGRGPESSPKSSYYQKLKECFYLDIQ